MAIIEKKFHGGSTGGFYFGIEWNVNSQSTSDNSSTITATVFIRASGSGYTISSSASKNISLTINGTTYSGTAKVGLSTNQRKNLLTKTVTVKHNSDGTKTCAFSCSAVVGLTLSGKYYGTISHSGSGTFPTINLNSAPWWTSNDTRIRWGGDNQHIRTDAIIPENVDIVEVFSSTATDKEQGGNLHYDLHRYINNNYSAQIKAGGSSLSVYDNLSHWGQGTQIKYEAKVHDGVLWAPDSRWSWTYTKNVFTRATVDSIGSIDSSSTSFSFVARGARNSGGGNGYVNTSFGYRIESLTSGIGVYGNSELTKNDSSDIQFVLGIERNGSNPSGCPHYLKYEEIKAALAGSNYAGNIRLRIVSWNSYGSSGTYDFNVYVDLRENPPWTTITYDSNSKITHKNTDYYIPSLLPFNFRWNHVSDPLTGRQCTYKIYYQIGEGNWIYIGDTSSNTYTAYLGSTAIGNSKQTNFRIIVTAITPTGKESSSGGSRITLWDYAWPSVNVTNVTRNKDNVVINGNMVINSSIPNIDTTISHYRWGNGNNTMFDVAKTSNAIKPFSIKININESFSGSLHVATSDTVRDLILKIVGGDGGWGNTNIAVKAYQPIMSLNKFGLGIGTRLTDGLHKFVVDGNMQTNGLNIYGYETTNSSSSYSGKWTKIADFQVTTQYGDATSIIKFMGNANVEGVSSSGELVVRLKQQNPMGQSPVGSITLNNPTDLVSANNFKLVIVTNTSSLTKGELWYKAARGYEVVRFCPITTVGTVNFYSSQGYQNNLPSGTQINAVNNTLSDSRISVPGKRFDCIPSIGGDGVMEVGKYIDFHLSSGETADYAFRITNTSNQHLDFSGHINTQNIYTNGYITLPGNGSSWLNGATNGNIRASRQSTGSYHSILTQTTSSGHKVSLGGIGDEFGFHYYDAHRTENGYDGRFIANVGSRHIYTNCSMDVDADLTQRGQRVMTHYWDGTIGHWKITAGGDAGQVWLATTQNGIIPAWSDGVNGVSNIGTIHWPFSEICTRTLSAPAGYHLSVNTHGYNFHVNTSATSGANLDINRQWSGSQGSEISIFNTKGNGWGFLGNSGQSFFRIYGAGGSVSDRTKKYEITKADIEQQYENVKSLNVYNYRTISLANKKAEELAEDFVEHAKFKDEFSQLITDEVELDGIIYKALDENLTQEEIRNARIKQVVENNPNLSTCKREDLMLGAMVDELPTEVTFYDNEGGDGKAVDMYSYTTMILGAVKHLINKVEKLELDNESKSNKIHELEYKLEVMEEKINGFINGE